MRLAFCTRNAEAAQLDLVRIATEIRAELESGAARHMAGAVYVSCSGRGGPHFGARHAELQVVRKALGDVPLVGFFAGGEIARHHLYGYTGVLTVFTATAFDNHASRQILLGSPLVEFLQRLLTLRAAAGLRMTGGGYRGVSPS